MNRIQTDEFGLCLKQQQAIRYLNEQNVATRIERSGELVFHYVGQPERRVLPLFIAGKGWYYPVLELARGYRRPPPEAAPVVTPDWWEALSEAIDHMVDIPKQLYMTHWTPPDDSEG